MYEDVENTIQLSMFSLLIAIVISISPLSQPQLNRQAL
jgi:hypothetical protein